MHSRKVILTAQLLISGMMAFLMTGFFAFLHLGFTGAAMDAWYHTFITAWPVAFCFSLIVSPIAFMIAGRLAGGRPSAQA